MIINFHEAQQFIDSIQDPIDKRFLTGFFVSVLLRIDGIHDKTPRKPEVDFDMLFYIHVVYDFIQHKKTIRSLLDGDTLDPFETL